MTGLDVLYSAMIHTAHTRGYVEMFLRKKRHRTSYVFRLIWQGTYDQA
jgi:hypothetical protein